MDSENEKTLEEKSTNEKVLCEAERIIGCILDEGIDSNNVDFLYKIVDIHKDIANEEYWQVKKEAMNMRYGNRGSMGNYGEYSEGSYGRRGRDSRGRYSEGSYGRRGVPGSGRGRYRGEEMMDEMMYHYGNYSEGREQYGADGETLKSFEYMLKSFKDYYKHLKQEASSQQEIQMLEETAQEMLDM